MIVIVSWYPSGDGGKPDVRSIPTSENALDELIEVMHGLAETSKEFRAFEVTNVAHHWIELGRQELQKENNDR